MRHNIRKTNQNLMWAVMAMAVIVLMIAALFLYWSAPTDSQTTEQPTKDTIL